MEKAPDAFRTISEVAEILDTPPHVLRFWESKFTQVRPVKRAGGRRYYRPADLALLAGIRQLLHDDGMTIRGVQKILRERGVRHVASLAPLPETLGDGSVMQEDTTETPEPPAPEAAAERASEPPAPAEEPRETPPPEAAQEPRRDTQAPDEAPAADAPDPGTPAQDAPDTAAASPEGAEAAGTPPEDNTGAAPKRRDGPKLTEIAGGLADSAPERGAATEPPEDDDEAAHRDGEPGPTGESDTPAPEAPAAAEAPAQPGADEPEPPEAEDKMTVAAALRRVTTRQAEAHAAALNQANARLRDLHERLSAHGD